MEMCIIVFLKLISACLNCLPKIDRERDGGRKEGREGWEEEEREEKEKEWKRKSQVRF